MNDITNQLVNDKLFELVYGEMYEPFVMITELGLSVTRNGGYQLWKENHLAQIQRKVERDNLEFQSLVESIAFIKTQRNYLKITAGTAVLALIISVIALFF